jgi:hypothetical protein
MTVAGLERALGRLLLDPAFCERFLLNPSCAAWEAGLPLSPIEIKTLSGVSRAAIERFRDSLEPSLRRHHAREAARPTHSSIRRDPEEGP